MPRIRTIKPGFWTDEKVCQLSPWARLCFIGLWNLVDDEGRLKMHPMIIKAQLFPLEDSLNIHELLSELSVRRMIIFYGEKSENLLYVPHFLDHQKVNRATRSTLPDPAMCAEIPSVVSDHAPLSEDSVSAHCGKGKERKGKEGKGTLRARENMPPIIPTKNHDADPEPDPTPTRSPYPPITPKEEPTDFGMYETFDQVDAQAAYVLFNQFHDEFEMLQAYYNSVAHPDKAVNYDPRVGFHTRPICAVGYTIKDLYQEHGKPGPKTTPKIISLCQKAIDGVVNDPWLSKKGHNRLDYALKRDQFQANLSKGQEHHRAQEEEALSSKEAIDKEFDSLDSKPDKSGCSPVLWTMIQDLGWSYMQHDCTTREFSRAYQRAVSKLEK